MKTESIESNKQWQTVAWWDAFGDQLTATTINAAVRVAEIEIARLARLGVAPATSGADVVQQVMLAICDGVCAWDPTQHALVTHLCHKVRSTVRGLRERPRNPRTLVALDEAEDEDPVWAERQLASDGVRDAVIVALARQVEGALWQELAGDPVALRALKAMSEGACGRLDLAVVLGVSVDAARRAQRRIARAALRLPDAVVHDVRAALNVEASTDGAR